MADCSSRVHRAAGSDPDAFARRPDGSLRACTSVRVRADVCETHNGSDQLVQSIAIKAPASALAFDCALDWVADLIAEGSAARAS